MTLEKRLERVSGSYEDFVQGALMLAKRFGVEDELAEYIDKNLDADSSDVYSYLFDYCGLVPLPIDDN